MANTATGGDYYYRAKLDDRQICTNEFIDIINSNNSATNTLTINGVNNQKFATTATVTSTTWTSTPNITGHNGNWIGNPPIYPTTPGTIGIGTGVGTIPIQMPYTYIPYTTSGTANIPAPEFDNEEYIGVITKDKNKKKVILTIGPEKYKLELSYEKFIQAVKRAALHDIYDELDDMLNDKDDNNE